MTISAMPCDEIKTNAMEIKKIVNGNGRNTEAKKNICMKKNGIKGLIRKVHLLVK